MKLLNIALNISKLIRALNCLIASAGVLVGAYLTHQTWLTTDTVVTAMAVFLICAGGNVLNDVIDVAIDRVSHPERVLVRGELSIRFAVILAVLLFAAGLTLASTVNLVVGLLGLTGVLLSVLYDLRLKLVLLLGNLIVSLMAGMTFLIGGAAAGTDDLFQLPGPLVPAVFALLFHLIREIVKDAEDLEGDRRAGIISLPSWLGLRGAFVCATGLTLGLVVLTVIPYYLKWFGLLYAVVGVGLAELPSLVLMVRLAIRPEPRHFGVTSISLKLGMVFGLVALVLG